MLAISGRIGKRRPCEAVLDNVSIAITTSIQRTYLVRKWYEAFKSATYTPVSAASTTADECAVGSKEGEWAWRPSPYSTFPLLPQSANSDPLANAPSTDQGSAHNVALWFPFFTNKRPSAESGRRFFARFSGPQSLTQSDSRNIESWRHSQSEDTYDLDENIVKLLAMEPSRLPKSCDPMTYCFWKHGLHRYFEPVSSTPKPYSSSGQNALTFSVCSYNVLCQRTLSSYVEQLYSHCPFEHLTWQRRWPLLAVELQMLDADIFCLQEVQYDHFEQDYMPLLSKLGYDGTFKKKLKKKSDGCATFWRRDKFRPILVHPVEYALPAPHEHSDSVALITVLEPLSNGSNGGRVVVANTHLIFQPALGATKLCQTALLLAHLHKVTRQYASFETNSPAPLILCGDFNSTPFSPLYSLLIEGQLEYEKLNGWSVSGQHHQPSTRYRRLNSIGDATLGPSVLPRGSECSELCTLVDDARIESENEQRESGCLRHSLNLRSVYDHTTKNGDPEVTMFLCDEAENVDYILYSVDEKTIHKPPVSANGQAPWTTSNVRENGLKCLERYRLPGPSQLKRTIGYLPNQYCASDHLPLMAKFALDT